MIHDLGTHLVTEFDLRPTALGEALRVEVSRKDGTATGFRALWEIIDQLYPGKYAVQVFPPRVHLFDQVNKYHLYVVNSVPGMDLFEDAPPGTRHVE